MDELINAIYKISLEQKSSLQAGNDDEFIRLLEERDVLMQRADRIREAQSFFTYSEKAEKLLREALLIDQEIASLLEERLAQSRMVLLHMNKTKQIMKNYQPYIRQLNGAFIDAKK